MKVKAVCIKDDKGPAENLFIGEVDLPEPTEYQLSVKVKCFGLNRMDISQRNGAYPPPPGASKILGVELSGIVDKVGSGVTKFKKGDEVFALLPGGAYAEHAIVEECLAMKKPESMSFEQAAAIPETWFTAYQALFFVSGFDKGQTILIHAGASGVGIAAIQLAKDAGAQRIFVTAGSDEKIKFCKTLGADVGFNYKTEKWAEKLAMETDNKGVNVIIDFIAQNYFNDNIKSLAYDGCLSMLALLSGGVVDKADISGILRKRLRIQGTTLRSRSLEYQEKLRNEVYANVIKKHFCDEKSNIQIFIDKTFDWKDIVEAHKYMESDQSMGKIIVTVQG